MLVRTVSSFAAILFCLLPAISHAQEIGPPAPAEASSSPASSKEDPVDKICSTIEKEAANNELPADFLKRVIWQESKFDPNAISRAGAQGIAQFMPNTAAGRGLIDPFDVPSALRESASYLKELLKTFGNLGLAAAAYNAGPSRLSRWIANHTYLPRETFAYVEIITGHPVSEWAGPKPPEWNSVDIPNAPPCKQLITTMTAKAPSPREIQVLSAPRTIWKVILSPNWESGSPLAVYEQYRRRFSALLEDRQPFIFRTKVVRGAEPQFTIGVGVATPRAAQVLCMKIQAAGGTCVMSGS
jgi:hypothetical protein